MISFRYHFNFSITACVTSGGVEAPLVIETVLTFLNQLSSNSVSFSTRYDLMWALFWQTCCNLNELELVLSPTTIHKSAFLIHNGFLS